METGNPVTKNEFQRYKFFLVLAWFFLLPLFMITTVVKCVFFFNFSVFTSACIGISILVCVIALTYFRRNKSLIGRLTAYWITHGNSS